MVSDQLGESPGLAMAQTEIPDVPNRSGRGNSVFHNSFNEISFFHRGDTQGQIADVVGHDLGASTDVEPKGNEMAKVMKKAGSDQGVVRSQNFLKKQRLSERGMATVEYAIGILAAAALALLLFRYFSGDNRLFQTVFDWVVGAIKKIPTPFR